MRDAERETRILSGAAMQLWTNLTHLFSTGESILSSGGDFDRRIE
jgi:hypothetical protein